MPRLFDSQTLEQRLENAKRELERAQERLRNRDTSDPAEAFLELQHIQMSIHAAQLEISTINERLQRQREQQAREEAPTVGKPV
jgi:membrane carboxypeptidase/penicillin-binding protein PbpC